MLAEFKDIRNEQRVIRERPWSFDKNLMMKKRLRALNKYQIKLVEIIFLIYLHDLLLMAINEYMGRFIGEKIGRAEGMYIEKHNMAWGNSCKSG